MCFGLRASQSKLQSLVSGRQTHVLEAERVERRGRGGVRLSRRSRSGAGLERDGASDAACAKPALRSRGEGSQRAGGSEPANGEVGAVVEVGGWKLMGRSPQRSPPWSWHCGGAQAGLGG